LLHGQAAVGLQFGEYRPVLPAEHKLYHFLE
jgi:hypothetical protein